MKFRKLQWGYRPPRWIQTHLKIAMVECLMKLNNRILETGAKQNIFEKVGCLIHPTIKEPIGNDQTFNVQKLNMSTADLQSSAPPAMRYQPTYDDSQLFVFMPFVRLWLHRNANHSAITVNIFCIFLQPNACWCTKYLQPSTETLQSESSGLGYSEPRRPQPGQLGRDARSTVNVGSMPITFWRALGG